MKKAKFDSKLNVFYNSSSEVIQIGSLVEENQLVYFKYHDDFLQRNINLSPFKLKFTDEIQVAGQEPFHGLFGLFADSLPDAWGQLLLNRFLVDKQLDEKQLTNLQRLSFAGRQGAGALEYQPCEETPKSGTLSPQLLSDFAQAAIEILNGQENELSSTFYHLGGTSGGARPKIDVLYNSDTKNFKNLHEPMKSGFESWIVKFPSNYDLPDIAQIEYAYHLMAKSAGINMSQCELFASSQKGQYFFGTKRFDRVDAQKIHKYSAAGLIHDNFQKSTLDYGHIIDVVFRLQKNRSSYEPILRLAAFNVFACNQDDHSKNFSFIMDENGTWSFAPAYDLTFSPRMYNVHSTTVANKQQNVTGNDLLELANHFSIKHAKEIIDDVYSNVQNWKNFSALAGVGLQSTKLIQQKIDSIRWK